MENQKATGKTSKGTLRKEIRTYIQRQIASGTYRAGDRIVETQLAKDLNVSQAPVREALLELAAMGLLEERPYSGTFVRKLTAEDIEDVYNTRAFIDEHAAKKAAQNINDEQLAALEALLHRMDEASDIVSFVEMDMQFHGMIVDAAGSPALSRMWESLRLVEWTGLSAAVTKTSLQELARQHWKFYQLLKNREDHAAGAYMFLHIKNFGEEMKRYVEKMEQSADAPAGKEV
jgi:DNA-binding GntR family transcriptional regulator